MRYICQLLNGRAYDFSAKGPRCNAGPAVLFICRLSSAAIVAFIICCSRVLVNWYKSKAATFFLCARGDCMVYQCACFGSAAV